jgi:ATP-binding cassette subfamily B protein
VKYTFVKQHDATDCAAACLAMVCLYYKKETTITRLRDMMGTDLKGTNLLGLSKSADELGFTTQAIRVDRKGFLSKYSLPAIANVLTPEGMTHFVVVFKVTQLKSPISNSQSSCISPLLYQLKELDSAWTAKYIVELL